MPALLPTEFTATIVWLGYNAHRRSALATVPLSEMALGFAGFEAESHSGLTRPSDSRVLDQHARGTEIRNVRQLSILSADELSAIAAEIGIDALDPALLGASMVIEGIADLTHVPPSARLQCNVTGTTLVVDMENRPCRLPAPGIEAAHPGRGAAFMAAAANRRGVTAWVERPGTLRLGAEMRLHVPDQPPWPHLDAARRGIRPV